MGDVMLYGVLRMPFDMAMSGYLSQRQFYDRVQEAARRLEAAEARLAEIDSAAPPSPSTAPVKDHVAREVVNRLRDTALEFHAHGSLRERLARELAPLLVASRPAEVDPAHLLREALADAVKLRTDIDKALERTGGAR